MFVKFAKLISLYTLFPYIMCDGVNMMSAFGVYVEKSNEREHHIHTDYGERKKRTVFP